jgi:MFS family permease
LTSRSAYLLTTCAFQLFFGKLYTFFSIKWVFLIALVIFEIGSAICGAAPNSAALIIGRAIAGVGSAGIFSGAILIVAATVPLRQRPTYMGLIGGMYGIASVAGPLMGGAFTDKLTWRWCFYINLPIGAVTFAFIAFFYHPTERSRAQRFGDGGWRKNLEVFDIYGTLVFLPMIVCLLLALQWGGSKYPWSNGRIIGLLVLFAVLLIVFIGIQFWKGDNATVPPRILKQRTVAAVAWFAAMIGAAFFTLVYFLPLYFQAIKGASAVKSGIMNLPLILSLVIMSMLVGVSITKIGYYTPFVIAGSILLSIGSGLVSTFTTTTPSSHWIGYQILFGFGMGMSMQQTLVASSRKQTSPPARRWPCSRRRSAAPSSSASRRTSSQTRCSRMCGRLCRAWIPLLSSERVRRSCRGLFRRSSLVLCKRLIMGRWLVRFMWRLRLRC